MEIQYHILGVLAYSKKKEKKPEDKYILPPVHVWTKKFCDTLNKLEFGKNKFCLSDSDNGLSECHADAVKKTFVAFKERHKVESIYIGKLPDDCKFVHFHTTVILSEDSEECARQCADSIQEGLGLMKTFREKVAVLKRKSSECAAIKDCEIIAKSCALQAHFTMDNKRSVIGSDHYCWNELLQNVDDHIAEDGKLRITLERDSLSLSYRERGVGGFTAKDFVAVCTSGNSGNVSDGQEDKNNISATGHKGTGFKSVYNFFKKVTIESGNIRCILDDTVKYDYSGCIKGDDFDLSQRVKDTEYTSDDEKKYFPVPEFEFLNEKSDITTITFTFKNSSDGYNKFLEQIGLIEKNGDPAEIPERYYFLNHIKEITYNEEQPVNLDAVRKECFYSYEETFEVTKELLETNPRWKNTSVEDFIDAKKNKIQFLFPKERLPEETYVFCSLPVCNETLDLPFYINCPALELEDSRNSLSGAVKEWNDRIQMLAYSGDNSCFHRIFAKFAEGHGDIAYRYFPFNYTQNWNNIDKIPFLQTNCNDIMSLSQWYHTLPSNHQTMSLEERKNGFVILPEYMYEWFQHKGDFNEYETSVPFLHYTDMSEWFAKKTGLLTKLYKTNEKQNVIGTLKQLFRKDGEVGSVVLDIMKFFEEKFYSIGVCNISEENYGEFCQSILRKLYVDEVFNYAKYAKCYCYRWYLGKNICEGPCHSLDGLEVSSWNSIGEYKTKYANFFCTQLSEEQFFLCFPNLRDKLYFERDISDWDHPQYKLVKIHDEFLTQAFQENTFEKLFLFASELMNEDRNDQRYFFDNGKVIVKSGTNRFVSSNPNLFTSSKRIEKDFILKEPQWARTVVENLDEKMKDYVFYDKVSLSFLKEVVPEYRAEMSIGHIICQYLNNQELLEEKERYLFEQLMTWEGEMELQWHEKYRPMLRQYDQTINKSGVDKVKLYFCFSASTLSPLPDYISRQLEDRLNTEEYETYKERCANIRYSTLAEDRYCIGKVEETGTFYWVVFGERGLGQFLRDWCGIQAYLSPRQCIAMSSYAPLPLFRAYDTELEWCVAPRKLPDNNAYDEWKFMLLERYEWKADDKQWRCAAGYGDPHLYKSSCPVCGGKLVVEATSLRVKTVRLCQNIHVPVLLCRNCADAFQYSYDVYFCKGKDNPEKLSYKAAKEQIGQNDVMHICFRLSGYEPKIFPIKLTLLHRRIALDRLGEYDEATVSNRCEGTE